jgi:hypothetical protein
VPSTTERANAFDIADQVGMLQDRDVQRDEGKGDIMARITFRGKNYILRTVAGAGEAGLSAEEILTKVGHTGSLYGITPETLPSVLAKMVANDRTLDKVAGKYGLTSQGKLEVSAGKM